ncbi:DDE-type integrase/transposase/recombinase [Streptosporangium carneum]|uniref:Integrase catalytic domain-containing protein n=1 Tax=Streptosporangium carneum TaxID=47481 RepID=A0A9W6I4M7_9ACTN|nr:DDE-type integrase/transposase/recombinase [Streptosporangium carneum]GLK12002.1 hypothetical protein GCM10017600_54100 [Streptosporangium carneum]
MWELTRRTCPGPVPSRATVHRVLIRHGLVQPVSRRRRREDYTRWQRSEPMQLWQMDIVGGIMLADGTECKIVTGVDDHSRYCVTATVVTRPTGRAVCLALADALGRHGIPDELLGDRSGLRQRCRAGGGGTGAGRGSRAGVMPVNGIDPVDLAVEFTRVVPASGNLTVCGQQFWLGTHRAGLTLTLRADTGTVELLAAGVRIKKVPSRLTVRHLRQLISEGGTRIQPFPAPARPGVGGAVEVERTVNASGVVSLGGRACPVGSPFAGRRASADRSAGGRRAASERRVHAAAQPAQPAHRSRDGPSTGCAPCRARAPVGR